MKEEFIVEVIKDYKHIVAGARFYVQSETKRNYKGIWPNGPHTSLVSVPKVWCKKVIK